MTLNPHILPALPTSPMRARVPRLILVVMVLLASAVGWLAQDVAPAAAAPAAINVCNGTDNIGGRAVECDVTVTNTLNLGTGVASSTVTVRECHGAANTVLPCTTTTTPFGDVTTSITQCNGSGSGGGGTVRCTVDVTNNITGAFTTSAATVNQCNGSGAGGGTAPTVSCSPVGAAPSATITQCNDSGNGGGATLRVQCTVASSTQTTALPVTINQCNGSGNGGGAFVTCNAVLRNNAVAAPAPSPTATPTPTPTVSPSASATATPSASPTATATATGSPSATAAVSPVATPSTTQPAVVVPVESPLPGITPDDLVALPLGDVGVLAATATGTSLPRTGSPIAGALLYGAVSLLLGIAFLLGAPVPGRAEKRVYFLDYVG